MANRLSEFFEDDTGRLSMTRLLCLLSIFPASYVVCIKPDGETLGWYVGAYVLGYVGGKFADKTQIGTPSVNVKSSGDINVS